MNSSATGSAGPGSWEGLLAELAGGTSLGSALLSVLPEAVRRTLRQCATVPRFTEGLYEGLLRTPGGPPLSELLTHGLVERALSAREVLRITGSLRQACWDDWWGGAVATTRRPAQRAVPTELAAFAATLAEHYRGAEQPVELVRQLLLCAPEEAHRVFVSAFLRADADYDLARGQDLLNALSEDGREELVTGAFIETRRAAQVRIQSRQLWQSAFNRSARYFSRPQVEKPLRDLLEAAGPRVVQLHAMGGTGKTMLLHWFTARYCMSRDTPVPCARVDFDTVDPLTAAGHPWLLLTEFAAQLDRQLPGTPFYEFRASYAQFEGALDPLTVGGGRAVLDGLVDEAAVASAALDLFVATLAQALTDRPVVLLLDTMEELTLRSSPRQEQFTALCGALLASVPQLRLVLSGRYPLAGRLAGFAEHLPEAVTLALTGFAPDEADRYLAEVRGMGDEELRRAVVKAAQGLPFTLSLYADLSPGLTVEQIESRHSPGLLYAIDRVLERIEDDRLRWILRYGVVPRRLTFDFLRNVMRPHLVLGIRGEEGTDDPDQDRRPTLRKEIFLHRENPGIPAGDAELRRLWESLTVFAEASSWLLWDAKTDGAVVVHPIVREPLRRLLSEHPVYDSRPLHRDAADYYGRLATAQPDRWPDWRIEQLYHLFQLSPGQGLGSWRAALAEAQDQDRSGWTERLATELLHDDFTGEAGEPGAESAALVPRWLQGEAHLLLAAAQRGAAAVSSDRRRWQAVLDRVEQAENLLTDHPEPDWRLTDRWQLAAEAALQVGEPEAIETVVRRLPAALVQGLERLGDPWEVEGLEVAGHAVPPEMLMLLAQRAMNLGQEMVASDLLRTAYRRARLLGPGRALAAAELGVGTALAAGRVDLTLGWSNLLDRTDPGELRLHGRILLSCGSYQRAVDLMAGAEDLDWRSLERARALAVSTHALLALRRPNAIALTRGADVKRLALDWARSTDGMFEVCTAEAEHHAALGDLQSALDLWQDYRPLGSDERARAERHIRCAELHLTHNHDARSARGELDRAALLGIEAAPLAERIGWRLAGLRVATLESWYDERDFQRLNEEVERDGTPALRRRTALLGLALCEPNRRKQRLVELTRSLVGLPTPESRLAALAELRNCAGVPADALPQVASLLQAVLKGAPRMPLDRPQDADSAALGLTLVELLRLAGEVDEALALLDRCTRLLTGVEPLAWRDWVAARARLGATVELPRDLVQSLSLAYPNHPWVAADVLVTAAESNLHDRPRVAETYAERAVKHLLRERSALMARAHDVLATARRKAQGREQAATTASRIWQDLGVRQTLRSGAPQSSGEPRETDSQPNAPETAANPPGPGARLGNEVTVAAALVGRDQPVQVQISLSSVRTMAAELHQLPAPWLDGLVEPRRRQQSAEDLFWEAGQLLLRADLPRELDQTAATTPVDLRFRLQAGALAGVPWEDATLDGTALVHNPRLRYLYRGGEDRLTREWTIRTARSLRSDDAELDGMVREFEGSVTTQARLTRLRDQLRLLQPRRPARVLLLTKSARSARSDHLYRPPDPRHQYDSLVWDLVNRLSGRWDQTFADVSADVLHIHGAMVKPSRAVGVDIDLGPDPDSTLQTPDELLSRLAHVLTGMQPLVVLEVPPVESPTERIRQLHLRNEFAHQLLEDGRVTAVLALGPLLLNEVSTAHPVATALTHQTPAQAWAYLCEETSRVTHATEHPVPELSPALFSHLPPDLLAAPGLDP
ncbi:hypothetical protein [Kitasatospora azatica]|uniref:hypothetical protein n=1 Tax=Kitasatospora azatica TaxID=58347 RepID=UPI000561A9A5|nr:hypothetical protein [Kitasatospora azatica]